MPPATYRAPLTAHPAAIRARHRQVRRRVGGPGDHLALVGVLRQALGRSLAEVSALDRRDRAVGVAAAEDPDEVADHRRRCTRLGDCQRLFHRPRPERAAGVECRLPGRGHRTRSVRAADQEDAVGGRGGGGAGAGLGQHQGLGGLLPVAQFAGRAVRCEDVRRRGRCAVGVEPAHHVDTPGDERHRGVGPCRGQRRTVLPFIEVPGPHGLGDEDVRLRGRAVRPADVQQPGPDLDDAAIGPRLRQRQLGRRGVPGHDATHRHRARQVLVLRRAEVDRRPRDDPQVDGLGHGEVVRAIRDVAQQQDDDRGPHERLDRRPGPTVRVEQTEHRPPSRQDHPGR